jgi:hypothetical protein
MGRQASAPLTRQRQLATRLSDLPMAAEQAHQCVEPNKALRALSCPLGRTAQIHENSSVEFIRKRRIAA